jgi:hypothetical protein
MPFGVSLEEYLSNFLRDFFFFADFVGRSNGWLNAVAHMIRLSGDHGRCPSHDNSTEKKYKPLVKDSENVKVMKELFEELKKNVQRYASGTSSNVCEAINNEITVYAPKRYNLADSYDWRVNLALLKHNEGPAILLEVIKQLGIPVSKMIVEEVEKKQKKKEYFKLRKEKAKTKEERAIQKEQKKKRGTKVMDVEHMYKGGNTPYDEEDNESLTREPKARRLRSDLGHCGCKKGDLLCKSGHCVCKQNGRKCNEKCGTCKDKGCDNRM